jgi:hypothetical protein
VGETGSAEGLKLTKDLFACL